MSLVEDNTNTAILKHDQSNISSEGGTTLTNISPKEIVTSTEEFLLTEDIDSQEETEDESDEEEVAKFFTLMNKAEKKNLKRIASKQNRFGSKKSDWRNVALEDPAEDSSDTG